MTQNIAFEIRSYRSELKSAYIAGIVSIIANNNKEK